MKNILIISSLFLMIVNVLQGQCEITCEEEQGIILNESCQLEVPDLLDEITDNGMCMGYTFTQDPEEGELLSSGHFMDHVVTVTADDGTTTVECEVTLTGMDVLPPVITCIDDITISLDDNCTIEIPSGLATIQSDNCNDAQLTYSIDPGETVSGSHDQTLEINVTATDNAGLTDDCTIIITMEDDDIPSITCINDLNIDLLADCMATIPDIEATSSDNCGDPIITYAPSDFSPNSIVQGTHNQSVTVTATATDVAGLTAECTTTITFKDNTDPTAICKPISVELSNSGTASITASQFNNGSSDNCTNITASNLTISQSSFDCDDTGTPVPVTLTVNDGNGNTGTATCNVTVTLPNIGLLPISPSSPVINCSSPSVTLMTSANAPITWRDASGNVVASGNSYTVSINNIPGNSGSATYTATACLSGTSNANCCMTRTITVTENTVSPTVTITGAPSNGMQCNGVPFTLSASGTSGNSYTWSGSTTANGSTLPPLTPPTGNYTVTVTATNSGNGCMNTDSELINILPPLVVSPFATAESCAGANDGFVAFSVSGGSQIGYNTLLIGQSQPGSSGMFNNLTPNAAYTITSTDDNGCTDNSIFSINTGTNVNVAIAGDNIRQTCDDNQNITLQTSGNAQNYAWNVNNQNASGSILVIGDNEGAGTYNVSLMGSRLSANQPSKLCSESEQTIIRIFDNPDFDLNAATELCENSVDEVCIANFRDDDSSMAQLNYSWNNSTQNASCVRINTNNPSSQVLHRLTVTDQNGCTNIETASTYINANPEVTWSFESPDSDDLPVLNTLFSLSAQERINETNTTLSRIDWCFNPALENSQGTISEIQNEQNPTGLFHRVRNDITVTAKIEDLNGCTNETSDLLRFRSQDDCNILAETPRSERVFCQGITVEYQFTHIQSDPNANVPTELREISYRFINGNGLIEVDGDLDLLPIFTFTDPGIVEIQAIYSEKGDGCKNETVTFEFTILELPSIGIFPSMLPDTIDNTSIEDPELRISLTDIVPEDAKVIYQVNGQNRDVVAVNGEAIIDLNDEPGGNVNLSIIRVERQDVDDCNTEQIPIVSYDIFIRDADCATLQEDLNVGDILDPPSFVCAGKILELDVNVIEQLDKDYYFVLSTNNSLNVYNDNAGFIDGNNTIRIDDSSLDLTSFADVGENVFLYTAAAETINSTCVKLLADPVSIRINPNPDIELVNDKSEYCLNEQNAIITVIDNNTEGKELISSTEYQLSSGFDNIRKLTGEDSILLVSLNSNFYLNNSKAIMEGEYSYVFEASDGSNQKCFDTEILSLDITDDTSLDATDAYIRWWPGNILAASFNEDKTTEYKYQWGRNGAEISGEKDWFIFIKEDDFTPGGIPKLENGDSIDYWVDVWTEATTEDCKLRLYYTGDGFQARQADSDRDNNIMTLYPNPAGAILNVEISRDLEFLDNIKIINPIGQVADHIPIREGISTYKFDTIAYSPGLYIVYVRYKNGVIVAEKILINN